MPLPTALEKGDGSTDESRTVEMKGVSMEERELAIEYLKLQWAFYKYFQ